MRIENTVDIDAPVSRVWEITLDVGAWPRYTSTMTAVELLEDGPVAIGSTARVKQPRQPVRVWTVTTLEPQHRFAWSTKTIGVTMTGWHILSLTATGTRNTVAIEFEGTLAPILGALLRPSIKNAIETENKGFKAAATLDQRTQPKPDRP